MGNLLRAPNGNGLFLVTRSGSHSIALAAMQSFWPEISLDGFEHPAAAFPDDLNFDINQENVGVIVRNPVERFQSMAAYRKYTIAQQLEFSRYRPLPKYEFARYFRFEDQLQECADWLGITAPLEQISQTEAGAKPDLTPEQEALIREIYADDIKLWESLQP